MVVVGLANWGEGDRELVSMRSGRNSGFHGRIWRGGRPSASTVGRPETYTFEWMLAFQAGRAGEIFTSFPGASWVPFIAFIADIAASLVSKLTKPNPIDIPDALSRTIYEEHIVS